MPDIIQTTGRTARVMQFVRQRIAAREWQPGARLPSLRSMALHQQVSKSTVVEAYERARGHLRRGESFLSALADRRINTGIPASSSWLFSRLPIIAFGTFVTTFQCGSSSRPSAPPFRSALTSTTSSTSTPQSGHISTHGSYSYPHSGHRWRRSALICPLYPMRRTLNLEP